MTGKKRWVILVAVIAVVGFLTAGTVLLMTKRKYEDLGAPVMEVRLNGVTLDEIDGGNKTDKYEGNEVTIYNSDGSSNVFYEVEMKGRGNGTWVREKKPYQIKFKQKVNLLDLGGAKKWNLLANHADDSQLRNELAFKIAEMLGMEYRMEGRYVELYVNDDYRGLYYLTHAVEIGKDTVDLKNPMGVLVEMDNYYGMMEDYYETNNGDYLLLKDVVTKDLGEVAMNDFVERFNELEEAVEAQDYEKISELIDVRSFAQYFLLSELSVNPDAYWASLYFYKDGPEDVIHAGPGWDFDMAFANRNWWNWLGDIFYSPRETMIRKRELNPEKFLESAEGEEKKYDEASLRLSRLFFDLMDIEEFQEEVKTLFRERLSGREVEVMSFLAEREAGLQRLIEKDGVRWGKNNYNDETRKVVDWLRERMDYMEEQYGEGTMRNPVL